MLRLRSLLVLAMLLLPLAAASAPRVIEGPARVIDGDTVEVRGERIRLYGIDAPEARQSCDLNGKAWACGRFAAAELRALIGAAPLSCEVITAADRYGRPVAICRAAGRDLGAAMVQGGAAVAFHRYSDRYAADEATARAARRGVWGARMVTPETQRAADRGVTDRGVTLSTQGTCAIKGNLSSKGERIYHVPGQKYYARTKIDKPGERMFCSEAEAEAAGFRRSKI